jgi:sirohydrochlorin ferrochelatase
LDRPGWRNVWAVPGTNAAPTLLAVAHGSRHPSSVPAVDALLDLVRTMRPGLVVRAAYLETVAPSLADALATPGAVVVVPLLLATGYHAAVDIPAAAAHRPDTTVTPVLGPDPLLAEALADRLTAAGWKPGRLGRWAVVLAAAGSTDPAAARATAAQAVLLEQLLGTRVVVGYASAAAPTVAEAVARCRAGGAQRVAVATYLLAPGHFGDRIAAAGGDLATRPLGDHPAVAATVLARYDAARAPRLAARST